MKKLRTSRQRELILQYLRAAEEHPTAETICLALREQMPNLSLGTVYRNLKVLEELGQVRRVLTPQQVERYDAHCEAHPHFVCSRCGCVQDLPNVNMEKLLQMARDTGLSEVNWVALSFGGLCPACAAEKNNN